MTRPLCLEFAGALYHISARGDRREEIYLDDVKKGVRVSQPHLHGHVVKEQFLPLHTARD
jgi:hypothetical protein